MGREHRWVVAWDFAERPKRVFYEILDAEFGDVERVQKTVRVARDAFTASRLRALLEWYGAQVCAYAIAPRTLDDVMMDEHAKEFIARVLAARGRGGGGGERSCTIVREVGHGSRLGNRKLGSWTHIER